MLKCDAVFEGGGVKGIAFVGAIQEAERQGYTFERLAGTSAGSMIASLLAAGYNGQELEAMMSELSFLTFLDLNTIGRIPLIGKGLNILLRNGIYSAIQIEHWIAEKLKQKGIYTFGDLPEDKLRIVASDITNGRMMVLPHDLTHYGKNPNDFSIAKAVRMSCTIPYFFQPAVIRYHRKKIYIVDGGLLSNYPVWIFDSDTKPRWPTFGFRLRGSHEEKPSRIAGPISMFLAIFSTMLEAHDKQYIKPRDAHRTIFIPVDNVKSTDFALSDEQKQKLMALGRKEAQEFFEKWNFPAYIQQYRRLPVSVQYQKKSQSS